MIKKIDNTIINDVVILICPVCKSSLFIQENSFQCINNHNFDKSKSGYVNLLLAHHKNSKNPGDSKEMVKSRLEYLQMGYYTPIAQHITNSIKKLLIKNDQSVKNIIDIGCGVGYYLSYIAQNLSHHQVNYWGLDISKDAIILASSCEKQIQWLIASAKRLPFQNNSIDISLSIFSPINTEEVDRVLKLNGALIIVTPASEHLIELRKELFDIVHIINDDKIVSKVSSYFSIIESIPIKYTIQLTNTSDIMNLLKMTPYNWKSAKEGRRKIGSLENINITVDVTVWIFSRILK